MVTDLPVKNRVNQPLLVRTIPFVVFVLLTGCQGQFGEASRYWFYLAKTILGAGMVWSVRPWISEMRWRLSWDAVLVGVVVFVLWVGLDGLYPSTDDMLKMIVCPIGKHVGLESWCAAPAAKTTPWNPHAQFGATLAWFFVLTRLIGATLVVPALEEVFYRSFLYRYLVRPEFELVPLACFRWSPFLITSVIFGLTHFEWLPGVLCGMLYQLLVLRHNQLGQAMAAHAITNALLGLWVIERGAWHFW